MGTLAALGALFTLFPPELHSPRARAISATESSRLGYGADGGWPSHRHHTHNSYDRP